MRIAAIDDIERENYNRPSNDKELTQKYYKSQKRTMMRRLESGNREKMVLSRMLDKAGLAGIA